MKQCVDCIQLQHPSSKASKDMPWKLQDAFDACARCVTTQTDLPQIYQVCLMGADRFGDTAGLDKGSFDGGNLKYYQQCLGAVDKNNPKNVIACFVIAKYQEIAAQYAPDNQGPAYRRIGWKPGVDVLSAKKRTGVWM